jgi:hypothetical protein
MGHQKAGTRQGEAIEGKNDVLAEWCRLQQKVEKVCKKAETRH